jgi:hypothetical protein
MSKSLQSNSEARPTLTSLRSTGPREAVDQATELHGKSNRIKHRLEAFLSGSLIPLTRPVSGDLFSHNPHEGLPVEWSILSPATGEAGPVELSNRSPVFPNGRRGLTPYPRPPFFSGAPHGTNKHSFAHPRTPFHTLLYVHLLL